jgi:hypothetical protein
MSDLRLIQSWRFPNVWSLESDDPTFEVAIFRDTLIANGAIAAEGAVTWAREHGHRITEIGYEPDREIRDPRSGRLCDPPRDVIAGIEYRSGRPVIESEATPTSEDTGAAS